MDFSEGVDRVKGIEKNASEHILYKGRVDVPADLDLYPSDIEERTIDDLVHQYEKIQKVIKTSQLEIFGKTTAPPSKPSTRVTEAETEMKKLRTEAIEELEKELVAPAPPPAAPPELKFGEPKEKPPVAPELTFEKTEEKPWEKPAAAPVPPAPALPAVPAPLEKPVEKKEIPLPPAPAPSDRYEEVQKSFAHEWGGKIDEATVKKKMLDLTKELFKEKSTRRREQIKTEIATLKNMLQELGKRRTKTIKDFTSPMLTTMESTQTEQLTNLKNTIAAQYQQAVEDAKNRFYQKLEGAGEGDTEARKKLYETFVFELTQLSEKMPADIQEKARAIAGRHHEELEKMRDATKDKKTLARIAERSTALEERYVREFRRLEQNTAKSIDARIQKIGQDVFQTEKEKTKKDKVQIALFEINEMDEGTLLYSLHSRDPELYKRYERHHLSKPEALLYAKTRLAQEKGLSDDAIRKFFCSIEGED